MRPRHIGFKTILLRRTPVKFVILAKAGSQNTAQRLGESLIAYLHAILRPKIKFKSRAKEAHARAKRVRPKREERPTPVAAPTPVVTPAHRGQPKRSEPAPTAHSTGTPDTRGAVFRYEPHGDWRVSDGRCAPPKRLAWHTALSDWKQRHASRDRVTHPTPR